MRRKSSPPVTPSVSVHRNELEDGLGANDAHGRNWPEGEVRLELSSVSAAESEAVLKGRIAETFRLLRHCAIDG